MILVGYRINENRSRIREKMDFLNFYSDCKDIYQRLEAITYQ